MGQMLNVGIQNTIFCYIFFKIKTLFCVYVVTYMLICVLIKFYKKILKSVKGLKTLKILANHEHLQNTQSVKSCSPAINNYRYKRNGKSTTQNPRCCLQWHQTQTIELSVAQFTRQPIRRGKPRSLFRQLFYAEPITIVNLLHINNRRKYMLANKLASMFCFPRQL